MTKRQLPALLLILDGFGEREGNDFNAINNANTPTWDRLKQEAPHTTLDASGLAVGLPQGQMGNSEVGHLNIGAGRVVYQSLTKITKAIEEGTFASHPVLTKVLGEVKASGSCLHIFGLLSPGGIHSHQDHLFALIELAAHRGIKQIYLHAFLDGRDTPPKSAMESLQQVEAIFSRCGVGKIATMSGRYYAMDRDKRWDRIEKAYRCMTDGESDIHATDAVSGLEAAYARGETDEFVVPTLIDKAGVIKDGDSIVFMNFRADRARQLTHAFVDERFDGFARKGCKLNAFVTLTEYESDLPVQVIYPPEQLVNTLGKVIAKAGLTQLRIAETEKYAHVTFFFNGGREEPFDKEQRKLIPSPKVATYDETPRMSVDAVCEGVITAIEQRAADVIICNFANPDMVGHTGDYAAAVKAIEAVDESLAKLDKAITQVGGLMFITADHGNADRMRDEATGQPHTAHTHEKVPLLITGRSDITLRAGGKLADIAPTLLSLLGIDVPDEMTGDSLLLESTP